MFVHIRTVFSFSVCLSVRSENKGAITSEECSINKDRRLFSLDAQRARGCSTLIFNSHVRVLSTPEVSIFNGPFMRAVRKIGGNSRYGQTTCSDRQARDQVEVVSIDCELLRKRLTYFFTSCSERAATTSCIVMLLVHSQLYIRGVDERQIC